MKYICHELWTPSYLYIYKYFYNTVFYYVYSNIAKIPTVLKYTTQLNVNDEVRIRSNFNNAIQDYHAISLWLYYPEDCMYIWVVNF